MATAGMGAYPATVHQFFEALRTYEPDKASQLFAADAHWEGPNGHLHGKDSIAAYLKGWLTNPMTRPSFTIRDIHGDGHVTLLDISQSGRFGQGAQQLRFSIVCLKNTIHQVHFGPKHAH